MKTGKLVATMLLCLGAAGSVSVSAFPEKYSPSPISKLGVPANLVALEAEQDDLFKAGEISIRPEGTENPTFNSKPIYHILYKGKVVYELNRDAEYPYLGDIWTADLDGNGLKDFVIYVSYMGNGIPPDNGVILFQTSPGVFRRLDFETYGFYPTDFTDIDKDGKSELVLCSMYQDMAKDGKLHSFLVYTAYRIENYSLKRMDFGQRGFPSFIWFTKKANSKETTKLSESQKKTYYTSLPSVIVSV